MSSSFEEIQAHNKQSSVIEIDGEGGGGRHPLLLMSKGARMQTSEQLIRSMKRMQTWRIINGKRYQSIAINNKRGDF